MLSVEMKEIQRIQDEIGDERDVIARRKIGVRDGHRGEGILSFPSPQTITPILKSPLTINNPKQNGKLKLLEKGTDLLSNLFSS